MSKARWSEFVNEYGNLDEVKNVFVLEQQAIENYEIKINKKCTLKSLLINTSYAVIDLNGVKTYYPVKANKQVKISDKEVEETLKRTIKYEEKLNDEEIRKESKVNLYEVDLSLLPSISGVKRKYVINIVSGKLYSINQVHYEGLIYHTPRYGVRDDNTQETQIIIHYKPGDAEGEKEEEQKVNISDSSAVTLKAAKDLFTKEGFVEWKDVTREFAEKPEDEQEFIPNTEGYFKIANNLSGKIGIGWQEDVLKIMELNEDEENDTTAEITNEINNYFYDYKTDIEGLLETGQSILGLAKWCVESEENIKYLKELQEYENREEEAEIAEGDIEYATYSDGATVDMAGEDMWLEAEWGTTVTLDANADGATVNNESTIKIGVKAGSPYGDDLLDAEAKYEGYVFKGWYTDRVDETTQITSEDTYQTGSLNAENTLYAHWELEDSPNIFTIRYYPENEGILQEKVKGKWVDYNGSYYEETKVKNSKLGTIKVRSTWNEMIFVGWYESDGTQVTAKTEITKNMDLYPKIQEVTLDYQGGEIAYRIWNKKYPNAYMTEFDNYYAKENKYSKIWVQNNIQMNKQATQARGYQLPANYSSWIKYGKINYSRYPKKTRTITTTDGLESKTIASVFGGWFTKPNGEGTKVNWNSIWKKENITENPPTLYANWTETKCAVTYDGNGEKWKEVNQKTGEFIEKEQQIKVIGKNKKPTYIAPPKKDGYWFKGWYDAPTDGNLVIQKGKTVTKVITEDTTLYAQWSNEPSLANTFTAGYATIEVIWLDGATNTPSLTQTPNVPILTSGGESMTPVIWDETEIKTTTASNTNWYKYQAASSVTAGDNNSSNWANAKTKNDSYFVWIPRFAYRITYYANASSLSTPTGYYDGTGCWKPDGEGRLYRVALPEDIQRDYTVRYNDKDYIVHPAFGSNKDRGGWDSETTGFWCAKFEMSGTTESDLKSTYNVGSMRNKTIENFYTYARNAKYEYTGTTDSFDSRKSYMHSHMMKNSEWGAVAYLTHSQYGRNGTEITINSNNSYKTGGGDYVKNLKQSSTGNIYGVYDLSGGVWEYVAAYDSTGSLSYLTSEISSQSTKYITKYTNGSTRFDTIAEANTSKLGDALIEVNKGVGNYTVTAKNNHMFGDNSYLASSGYPFFHHGGAYDGGSVSGVFTSGGQTGAKNAYGGFRSVLTP